MNKKVQKGIIIVIVIGMVVSLVLPIISLLAN